MSKMSIREAAAACGGRIYNEPQDGGIEGAAIDSRDVKAGYMFVAIKGERTDGHRFIPQAEKAGASCILMDNESYLEKTKIPAILVDDVIKAFQDIARVYRASLDLTVIGVTGSVGKTSTADMIKAVCQRKYKTVKTKANLNNHIGLPLSVMALERDTEVGILEMGMNAAGEIELLTGIAVPDIAVITNIGISHIEFLGTRENIFKAKMEITSLFKEGNILIVDGEDDYLKDIENKEYDVIKVGGDNSIYCDDIVDLGDKGITFKYVYGDDSTDVDLKLLGTHNAKNASLALTCGLVLGIDPADGKEGLADMKLTERRLHVSDKGDLKIIDDTYNASPASAMAAIDVLCNIAKARKVAVLGDMLELGECTKEAHLDVGKYAAEKGVDMVICIGDKAWDIYKGAGRHGVYFKHKEDLYGVWDKIFMPTDTVLVKASKVMHLEDIAKRLRRDGIN